MIFNMDEGTKVFLFIFVIGIFVALVLTRAKWTSLANRFYKLATIDFKKALLLIFVHFMILYLIFKIISKLWKELYFYRYYLGFLAQSPIDFPRNPLTWIVWFLAIVPVVILVLMRLRLWNKSKTLIDRWITDYREHPATFILSSFGFLGLISALLYLCFSWESQIERFWRYYYSELPMIIWPELLTGLAILLFDFFTAVVLLLLYVGVWKRLRNCFLPNLYYYAISMAFNFVGVIIDCVELNRGMIQPSSSCSFWLDQMLNRILFPSFYFLIAWLFYRWSWFETAKVDKDISLPSWMNHKQFWWWVFGFSSLTLIMSSISEIHWLLWGAGSK
ncbi:MAG TPA: hypothetical protein VK791_10175 [bacterium]|nr:hypothetical protein [bacterium]